MVGAMFSAGPLESPDCYCKEKWKVCRGESLEQVSAWGGGSEYIRSVVGNISFVGESEWGSFR